MMATLFILFQNPGGGGGLLISILPWLLIFGVFYVLIILPQRKRQRELQDTIANLKAGDRVVTTGGIIGTITAVRETSLLLRSADKSILEVARSAVAGLQGEEEKK
jgi:preprotein translocase subunit YajC